MSILWSASCSEISLVISGSEILQYLCSTPLESTYLYTSDSWSLIFLSRSDESPGKMPNMDSRWHSMSLRRFRRSAFTLEKVSSWGMMLPSS